MGTKTNARLAMAIAHELRAARNKTGLTQAEVARRMAMPRPIVTRIESGQKVSTLETIVRYCDAIDIDAAALIGDVLKRYRYQLPDDGATSESETLQDHG